MKLAFTKMHGAGNDFVVIDATKDAFALTPTQLKKIADRHFGVGCDQILVVEQPRSAFGVLQLCSNLFRTTPIQDCSMQKPSAISSR